jgi:hypothetical protein
MTSWPSYVATVYQMVTPLRGHLQLVRSWQWITHGEWVRQGWDRFIQQMEDRTLNRPPQLFRQCLDLRPG